MSESYALIGDGRLATSLAGYLPSCGVELTQWSRRRQAAGKCGSVADVVGSAAIVLIAIRDDVIIPFTEDHAETLNDKTLIHFSGALVAEKMTAMHPLYAFPPEPVPVEIMGTIPFVCDRGGAAFGDVFPEAPNPHFEVDPDQRPLYHALAVLSGNLATFLWNEVAGVLKQDLALDPVTLMRPYLHALIRNYETSPFDSLTGPVKRRDMETINRNLDALRGHPRLKLLYEAFLEAALTEPPDTPLP